MKESRLVKIVLIMILSLIVILGVNTKYSFAANNITITDLTGSVGNNTTENNTTGNNTTNNTVVNNSTSNNVVLTTNNTSNYNNSSLPDTGIEDSMPTVLLIVVLGISAVYAYKKMQDYKSL